MTTDKKNECKSIKWDLTRRQFIKTTAAGAAAIYATPAIALGLNSSDGHATSRVVSVTHERLFSPDERIDTANARQSVDAALLALTGNRRIKEAWTQIFPDINATDTIGLKTNCINRKCPSHPEIVYAIAESAIDALEINPNNIIIWDRATSELKRAGYTINPSDKGIRCFGTVESFSIGRWVLNVKQSESQGIGYDQSQPIDVGEGMSSHLSNIITRMCTYLINVPVLKDHRLAGITMSLKNHFGSIDNPRDCHTNRCDPFVANINAADQIRKKTKLIICDAAYGVYDGGPRGAPQWRPKSIMAATDPVALDFTGMQIINKMRRDNNLAPVTDMAIHVRTAQGLGLGTCNPKKIDTVRSVIA